jgi:hypothetical protein
MKKNLLHVAVASGVAGLALSAQADMYLNPEGTGQVLLYPYYNSENGNETSIHIVNTTEDAKAVKVRIMEYVNSQEVLDFNLYLSPEDHFAFTIFQNPNGDGGALITKDNSCTVPALGDETVPAPYTGITDEKDDGRIFRTQPFLPYQFAGDGYDDDYRTRIGHVEVIEMGVVENNGDDTYETWLTHGADGVPADCGELVAAWTEGGSWDLDATAGITTPTGGLYGISNHLNNTDAAAYGIEPAAIESFWAGDGTHTDPGNVLPSLVSGDNNSLVPNAGEYFALDFTAERAIDAVSSLFMADSVSNDVMTNPNLGGMTDWVVTFPTRRYYVNGDAAIAPFTDLYVATTPNSSCEDVLVEQWDREESVTETVPGAPIFSPPPPDTPEGALPQLCYETNTIAVNGVSSLNATVSTDAVASAAIAVANDNGEGWQRITFADDDHVLVVDDSTGNGTWINGLPAMGFAAFKYVNGDAVYGFVSDHKTDVTGSALQ